VRDLVLLGVDGGGTRCRARLADLTGKVLGEGLAGPANLRWGLEPALCAVRESTAACLAQADLQWGDREIVACLALAGASEFTNAAAPLVHSFPFEHTILTTDAQAACIGAHAGKDGGIVIIGTGSIGWAMLDGQEIRVGGWGFPISDEGSGAWIGCEAIRRVLLAVDGLASWTHLLSAVFSRFSLDPHRIVHWMGTARPQDFAALAPIVVEHALSGDSEAVALMERAAHHIDAIATRLIHLGVPRLSLMGGLADKLKPFLSTQTRIALVAPAGDALSGALHLARAQAGRLTLNAERKTHHG
jgi:glucosamine kinase